MSLKAQLHASREALLTSGALAGSMADFADVSGRDITERVTPYFDWQALRKSQRVWPFVNTIHDTPNAAARVTDASGNQRSGINLASQDYLGLAACESVRQAVIDAIGRFGIHSASAPVLQGNTDLSRRLEKRLADFLRMKHVLLFPTGWAAGFGAIAGLIRPRDHVVLDQYAHNCCVRGAMAATPNVHRFRHLSNDKLARLLERIRAKDQHNAVMVVSEGIFSMDADSPDVPELMRTCQRFDAMLVLDVAHDLGSIGPEGTGLLGVQGVLGKVDLVIGSFSKVFASNGGFVATQSKQVYEYLRPYSASHTFSNAISPPQCAAVLAAIDIVQSEEGERLRTALMQRAEQLRQLLSDQSVECLGKPGPLVPALLGPERVGRLAAALCHDEGVFANLVEYPAVSVGASRFRMQLMASHTGEQIIRAAGIVGEAIRFARGFFDGLTENGLARPNP